MRVRVEGTSVRAAENECISSGECDVDELVMAEIKIVGLLNPTPRNLELKFTTSTTYALLSGNVGLFVRLASIILLHLDRTARFIERYCALALPSRIGGRRLRDASIQPLPISPLCFPFLRKILQAILSIERQVNACGLPIPLSASWPSRGSVADVMTAKSVVFSTTTEGPS